jgi:nicotinamidase-related amidase
MNDTALLIVDMQNDFVLPDGPMIVKGAAGIIPNVSGVLAAARKDKIPVFHVIRSHRKGGCDIEITRREYFSKVPYAVAGSLGARIIDELQPIEGEYIVKKTRMSAFLFTELDSMLRRLQIKRVIIAGIQTPNCIRATAVDAVAHDYETFLVDDAIAAETEDIHKYNLNDMGLMGVKLIHTADLEAILH